MFTTKTGSSSFSISASAKKPMNSRNQFVAEIKSNAHNIFNKSFDTAEQLFSKGDNLKQTKLCIRKSTKRLQEENEPSNELEVKKCNGTRQEHAEVFLLPAPRPKRVIQLAQCTNTNANKTISNFHVRETQNLYNCKSEDPQQNSTNVMARKGRDMVVMIGKVDFCLTMRKKHPDLNILCDVYGKLVKVLNGKLNGEHILLLRNEEKGPILQSVYFDFNGVVEQFDVGIYLRAVGRFTNESRLQTFKLKEVDMDAWQLNFMRMQNVTSFVLLQQGMQNGN